MRLNFETSAADADLHPGNILVRVTDPNSLWGRITNYFNIHTSPKLILLDVGMTAELQPEDQQSLINLFRVGFLEIPKAEMTRLPVCCWSQNCRTGQRLGMFSTCSWLIYSLLSTFFSSEHWSMGKRACLHCYRSASNASKTCL